MLDKTTQRYLPVINYFCETHPQFILVGGSALALQISKRISVDFDLFTHGDFDAENLRREFFQSHQEIFSGISENLELRLTAMEANQLHFAVDEKIKITLLQFPYPITSKKKHEKIPLASLESIFAMKLLVILQRVEYKDFYDIAVLLGEFNLKQSLKFLEKMIHPEKIDTKIILKRLTEITTLAESAEDSILGGSMNRKQVEKRIMDAVEGMV